MKTVTFFTIHQAPHNTFTFRSLDQFYNIKVFYLKEKLTNYNWENTDFYYPGETSKSLYSYVYNAFKTDLAIISGWQSYKYVILILLLLIFNKEFAIYLDLDINSLRKHGFFKRILLRKTPIIFITGLYGERFLKRYLKKKDVYNFPYAVKTFNKNLIESINKERKNKIAYGDKIRVFISNRFIERKGYHLVRYLISSLKENNLLNNFQFSIAGNGILFHDEKSSLLKICEDLQFLGWIEYQKYRQEMIDTDIYLHCSEYEPYGIPPVDAFCCKKEIILTKKVYSYYDIIQMGGKVRVFSYNHPEELFTIFNDLSQNRDALYLDYNVNFLEENEEYLFKDKYLNVLDGIFSKKINKNNGEYSN
jgi:hypothetical protein